MDVDSGRSDKHEIIGFPYVTRRGSMDVVMPYLLLMTRMKYRLITDLSPGAVCLILYRHLVKITILLLSVVV